MISSRFRPFCSRRQTKVQPVLPNVQPVMHKVQPMLPEYSAPPWCFPKPPHWYCSSTSLQLRRLVTAALVVAAVAVSCFLMYRAAESILLGFNIGSPHLESQEHRLERTLNGAAMDNKTVILTTLNEAWASPNSIVDLFLESFRIGEQTRPFLKNLVLIALDEKAFSRCLLIHPHCFLLTSEGTDFSKEAYFMTPAYLKMMWRRIDFLRSILEMGYSFVFTDADIMWFRNPFPHFHIDADFQIACDRFSGTSDDVRLNIPNGGFNFVRSNNRTIEFYKFWYNSRETYPGLHDQDVLNQIKNSPFIRDIGMKMRFLDTSYFGGFCEPSKDLNQVCTMHANCCLGLHSKLHDLTLLLQDWKTFMSLSPTLKETRHSSWSVPQNCSVESLFDQHSPAGNPEPLMKPKGLEESLDFVNNTM
ncbi:hypothetical protein LIER_02844 [Lithospermum erythrorhizon]|uniref:Glycosyltransferase n=1 Tax=Lithospermum erythrorhizon TaxID=34254 RepID=A0AAV3NUU0_LITER